MDGTKRILLTLIPAGLLGFPCMLQADTIVGGPIDADTVWEAEKSPYLVTLNVAVSEDVTLTIEPNVVVKFTANRCLQVSGCLLAQGTETEPIVFTSDDDIPDGNGQPGDWGYVEFTETAQDAQYDPDGKYVSGCIMEYCQLRYGGGLEKGMLRLLNASPYVHNCIIEKSGNSGVYAYDDGCDNAWISSCQITGNSTPHYDVHGGGVYCAYSKPRFTECSINNNNCEDRGAGIYCYYSGPIFEDCCIIGNHLTGGGYGQGSAIYIYAGVDNPTIRRCCIMGNTTASGQGCAILLEGHPTIEFCHIAGNDGYAVENYNSAGWGDHELGNNYWGSCDALAIRMLIYDWYHDNGRGKIDFYPYMCDFDDSWQVDFYDYAFFAWEWLNTGMNVSDLNGDYVVYWKDLGFFASYWLWRSPCSGCSIPP